MRGVTLINATPNSIKLPNRRWKTIAGTNILGQFIRNRIKWNRYWNWKIHWSSASNWNPNLKNWPVNKRLQNAKMFFDVNNHWHCYLLFNDGTWDLKVPSQTRGHLSRSKKQLKLWNNVIRPRIRFEFQREKMMVTIWIGFLKSHWNVLAVVGFPIDDPWNLPPRLTIVWSTPQQ